MSAAVSLRYAGVLALGVLLLAPGAAARPHAAAVDAPAETLEVYVDGSGSGSVSSTPEGIAGCDSSCSAEFPTATRVSLTATPASGSRFAGWTDDCSGTAPMCVVTMDAYRSVGAVFERIDGGGRQTTVCVVPDVTRKPLAAAQSAITAAGCSLGTVTEASSATVPRGSVISQTPAVGSQQRARTRIDLTVSKGVTRSADQVRKGEVVLGVLGNLDRFASITGQRSRARHIIMGFGQATGPRLDRLLATMGEIPLVGFSMRGYTARDVARGRGDAFLVDLNRAAAEWPGRIYIRPWGEMNGHWNDYCAFNSDGSSRGPARSTASFRKAFARAYLIVHGAPNVNAELRRLGLPPVQAQLLPAPFPRVRVIWNPQGYGSPNIRGNSAAAYYPGDRFVDVVGNDLYNIRFKAEWAAAEALYRRYRHKPHAFPEWANWGIDDPGFIRRMAQFVRTHPKVELLAYYNGNQGSEFDLSRFPRSRAAYRRLIPPLAR